MNVIGKIFVFAVFVMSLMLMTFAGAIYMSHVNWKDEVYRDPKDCLPGQQPGYAHLIEQAKKERAEQEAKINELQQKVAESEQSRDQVIAKLQTALVEKNSLVKELRDEKDRLQAETAEAVAEMKQLREDLATADADVEKLAAQVREQQMKVDSQVGKSAKLSADLAQTQAQLVMAEERKAQLERQMVNVRRLLEQNGLTVDSLPRDQVPKLEGNVLAVAAGSIQVSLGSDDGLQVGHALEVYRNGEYIGRAVVRSVTPDQAVAEIMKEYARGIVQRGDKVTTRLKA
jgi:isoleucyl-tRNA synthetase